jgi:hypothetical protein
MISGGNFSLTGKRLIFAGIARKNNTRIRVHPSHPRHPRAIH